MNEGIEINPNVCHGSPVVRGTLLDENFPRSAIGVVEDAGHEAVYFSDVGNYGDDDGTVFARAQELGGRSF